MFLRSSYKNVSLMGNRGGENPTQSHSMTTKTINRATNDRGREGGDGEG